MTPERKEEIRRDYGDMKEVGMYVPELLAALEETERQLQRTNITSSVHEGNSDAYFAETERLRGELAEAQQTIARLTRFPRQVNSVGGWTIDYSFLSAIEAELLEATEYSSSMEQIQEVLLIIEGRNALVAGEGAKES